MKLLGLDSVCVIQIIIIMISITLLFIKKDALQIKEKTKQQSYNLRMPVES